MTTQFDAQFRDIQEASRKLTKLQRREQAAAMKSKNMAVLGAMLAAGFMDAGAGCQWHSVVDKESSLAGQQMLNQTLEAWFVRCVEEKAQEYRDRADAATHEQLAGLARLLEDGLGSK